jgi:hypothetical protein
VKIIGEINIIYRKKVLVKVKLSLYRPRQPRGLQEVEDATLFRQSAHEGGKVFSSTLRPLSPTPPGKITCTHFCWRLIKPQSHNAARWIKSIGNIIGPIRNQTRDLLDCSAMRYKEIRAKYRSGDEDLSRCDRRESRQILQTATRGHFVAASVRLSCGTQRGKVRRHNTVSCE